MAIGERWKERDRGQVAKDLRDIVTAVIDGDKRAMIG